jgi:hypothetical protein
MESRAVGCDPLSLHAGVHDHLAFIGGEEFIEEKKSAIRNILSMIAGSTLPDGVSKSDSDFFTEMLCEFSSHSIPKGSRLSYAEFKRLIREMRNHREELQERPSVALHHLHICDTMIEEYRATFSHTVTKNFFGTNPQNADIESAVNFVQRYVGVVEDFISPEVLEKIIETARSKTIQPTTSSGASGSNYISDEIGEASEEEEDGGSVYDGINFQDLARVNINQVYKYDNKLHFRDTIKQYQGLQQKVIPESVIDDVKKMIKLQGLEDPSGKYSRVTKDHVRKFLVATKNNSYYEDIQLIYSRITGKPCPNISMYEPILYKEFDELVEAFKQLQLKRTNFLNCHYVLKQLLKRQKYRVPEGDLPCLKTPNRLREHHGIYQKCCEILGWTFTL